MMKPIKLSRIKRRLIVSALLVFLFFAVSACQPPAAPSVLSEPVVQTTPTNILPTDEPTKAPTALPPGNQSPLEKGLVAFQLTNEEITQYHPQWSPDGTTLGFVSNQNGKSEIWLLHEGAEKAVLFPLDLNGDFAFSWSSDGAQMIFDAYDNRGVYGIWRLNYPDGIPEQVSPAETSCTQPAWSPDSDQIICQTDGDLFILEVETGVMRPFEESTSIEWLPQWSPDGTMILFTSIRTENADLWLKPVAGGEAIQLTTDEGYDDRGVWSPDGRFIAFVSDRAGNDDLWLYELSTGNLTQITTHEAVDSMPAWHPDGKSIVFASERSGNMDIWSVDVSSIVEN